MDPKLRELLAIDDPNGSTLPAEVRVKRDVVVVDKDGGEHRGPWGVSLDYGPLIITMPMLNPRAAELVARALIALMPEVDYDLSALS